VEPRGTRSVSRVSADRQRAPEVDSQLGRLRRGFRRHSRRIMELITILNRCHRFRGFVYQQAHFSADQKSIEFIPLWGFFVFLLYAMRRVDCRRCGSVIAEEVPSGDGKRRD
jgi:hypothetical protein